MTTNLLSPPTTGSDRPRPENDEGQPEVPPTRVDADPAGIADSTMGDPAIDEREWYPPPDSPCM
jgi:hypothetical protein